MVFVVDIKKLIEKLHKAKCGMTIDPNKRSGYGHTIERVLREVLESIIEDNVNSWTRMPKDEIEKIFIKLTEQTLSGVK